ncbi:MAG: hypothetical protein EOM85_02895 [Candidatus Moranbacteria bacterium]|nr:hypothetical protein [Candidatus Moranbacteria bacterium]
MLYYMYKVRKEVIDMSKYFKAPTQVVFTFDNGTNRERRAGIAYHDEIICACCGGIFEMEEDLVIEKELPWVDFCEEIGPDEDYSEIEDEEEDR